MSAWSPSEESDTHAARESGCHRRADFQHAGMNFGQFGVIVRAAVVLAVALGLAGCGKRQPATGGSESPQARAKSTDFVQSDSETTDLEQHCLDFGRSVMLALAARNYEEFYGQLSSHAKAQMSLNQFVPEEDDAKFERNEKMPRRNVALPEFLTLMAAAEKFHGSPRTPIDLHVHTSDPAILAGTATLTPPRRGRCTNSGLLPPRSQHPGGILAPGPPDASSSHGAEDAFGMRHHDRDAAVGGRERGDAEAASRSD
jgi:hypothetical protein